MPILTKSEYLAGLQCHKLLWFLINQNDKVPEPSKDALHKMKVGTEVGLLATKLYPDGMAIPTDDFNKNLELTKQNLDKTLFEAGIMANNCFSRIDILKPNGDGFDIIEVKSGTKVKDENIQDVSFQKHCCEMAGLKIKSCSLCFVNKEYLKEGELNIKELFTIQDITEEVIKAQENIQERIDNMFEVISNKPEIVIGKQCKTPYVCTLMDKCWKFLPKNNVFKLYRGGKKSIDLFKKEILSIGDIPDDFKLTGKQEIQRQCEKTKKPHIQPFEIKQFLETLKEPLYYLDFETFAPVIPKFDNSRPYQRIPFQFSLHINDTKHISFLAEGRNDPRQAFLARLKEVLGTEGSIIVYNEAFEKGVLKELARDFPEYQEWVDTILPRVVDLLPTFRNFHYYHPSQEGSASIKKVLPALTGEGYEGMDIAGGMDASISFEETMFGEMSESEIQKVRLDLEKYCELDTWAEVLIVRALKAIIS